MHGVIVLKSKFPIRGGYIVLPGRGREVEEYVETEWQILPKLLRERQTEWLLRF